jgi:hypothetical protein
MVTLEIEDRVADALKTQARARGVSLQQYLQFIVELQPSAVSKTGAPGAVEEFDAALNELFSADTRPLPKVSSSYSREDLYCDHD